MDTLDGKHGIMGPCTYNEYDAGVKEAMVKGFSSHRFPWLYRIESNLVIQSIRNGLVMSIPVLLIGSFSLICNTLPIPAYQRFLETFGAGILIRVFTMVYNATFGLLSVYMAFSIGMSCCRQCAGGNAASFNAAFVAVASFAIYSGVLQDGFVIESFGAKGMFTAIFSAMTGPLVYIALSKRMPVKRLYAKGADATFNTAIGSVLPAALAILAAVLLNLLLVQAFHVSSLQDLFIRVTNMLFSHMGASLLSGLLVVFLSSFMWFFGVHGSDVLEGVMDQIFVPGLAANQAAAVPTEIFTKEFFDAFALMGGCGATLSLLVAVLLFSRHVGNRKLAMLSALPMAFNINEMIVFGLPLVFNPVFFIPFLLTPTVCVLISYAAMSLGLVPLAVASVKWTTPILLGGYMATGSIAGSLLQLFNLAVGVLIYAPFVRLYDREKARETIEQWNDLARLLQDHEESGVPVVLTENTGPLGSVAKTLAMDLAQALERQELTLHYQPCFNEKRRCIGAEGLLRWRHPTGGLVYPPLAVKLAEETGILEELELFVLTRAAMDLERLDGIPHFTISANVTVKTLQSPNFLPFLEKLAQNYPVAGRYCIEVTEQIVLRIDERMEKRLEQIRALGFSLAVDDFSMGNTSLKYLQSNQFDVVKLDGSLVRGLGSNENNARIISSIVHLSKSLNFKLLAEFVETGAQREKLQKLGCYAYQGYLFSPAVPFEELEEKLYKRWRDAKRKNAC